jgi:hypothetical protein
MAAGRVPRAPRPRGGSASPRPAARRRSIRRGSARATSVRRRTGQTSARRPARGTRRMRRRGSADSGEHSRRFRRRIGLPETAGSDAASEAGATVAPEGQSWKLHALRNARDDPAMVLYASSGATRRRTPGLPRTEGAGGRMTTRRPERQRVPAPRRANRASGAERESGETEATTARRRSAPSARRCAGRSRATVMPQRARRWGPPAAPMTPPRRLQRRRRAAGDARVAAPCRRRGRDRGAGSAGASARAGERAGAASRSGTRADSEYSRPSRQRYVWQNASAVRSRVRRRKGRQRARVGKMRPCRRSSAKVRNAKLIARQVPRVLEPSPRAVTASASSTSPSAMRLPVSRVASPKATKPPEAILRGFAT